MCCCLVGDLLDKLEEILDKATRVFSQKVAQLISTLGLQCLCWKIVLQQRKNILGKHLWICIADRHESLVQKRL